MEKYVRCSKCNLELFWAQFTDHVENVHLAPKANGDLTLSCGICEFKTRSSTAHLMVRHCLACGHDTQQISTDLKRVLERENDRLRAMISLGVRICAPATKRKRTRTQSLRDTWAKRLQNNHSKDANISGQKPLEDATISSQKRLTEVYPSGQIVPKKEVIDTNPTQFNNWDEDVKPSLEELILRPESPIENVLMKCSLCDYQLGRRPKAIKREGVIHAFTHDKSLAPFQCLTCEYRTYHFGTLRSHLNSKLAQEIGCDGRYVNVQTEEMVKAGRALLKNTFPLIDWDRKLPTGNVYYGIKL